MNNHHDRQSYLNTWYATYPGILLSHVENCLLKDILSPLCGYFLLQLGHLEQQYTLNKSGVLQTVHIKPQLNKMGKGQINANYTQLPIANASIDSVFLPHIIEYETNIEDLLDEAIRVLIPEGYIIIVGFNPHSFLGCWEYLKKCFTRRPSKLGNFCAVKKLTAYLNDLDAEVVAVKSGFFSLPLTNQIWLKRLNFLEILGRACWPQWGASYVLVAQKKVIPLMPIRPVWQTTIPTTVTGQIASPTTRSYNRDQTD